MPYLNVKICAPQSSETTSKVASFLTKLTADVLHKKKELTSVAIEYMPAHQWFIGGSSLLLQGAATFYLDIKVTEGINTKNEKVDYIKKFSLNLRRSWGVSIRRAISSSMKFVLTLGVMRGRHKNFDIYKVNSFKRSAK